jgi:hypothetical protein
VAWLGVVVLFVGFVGAGLWLLLGGRDLRRQHPACGHCGYDLTASTSNRCPECGLLFIEAGVRAGNWGKRPWSRRAAGIVVLLVGMMFMPCLASTLYMNVAGTRAQALALRYEAAAAAARAYEAVQAARAAQAAQETLQDPAGEAGQ